MMNAAYAMNRYHSVSTTALSKEELLVRLLGQAIRDTLDAKMQIMKKDFAGKGMSINHAMRIVDELEGALDPAQAPQIVLQVSALYRFVRKELMRANQKLDMRACENAARVLKQMQTMWELAIAQAAKSLVLQSTSEISRRVF